VGIVMGKAVMLEYSTPESRKVLVDLILDEHGSSLTGPGQVEGGLFRQSGNNENLSKPAELSLTIGMEHSPTSATGTGWERTPWHAVQSAACEALRKAVSKTSN
jgi:hypothetical protein